MKIRLKTKMESFLIPLYGKAMMTKDGAFDDPYSLNTIEMLDYDFSRLKVQKTTQIMLSFRSGIIDDLSREFLRDNSNALVLHLGCGLDSRYLRLGKPNALWYDLDFPEIITIREQVYPMEKNYSYIPSSVTDHSWFQSVSWNEEKVLIIAEGLLMYLTEKEIRELLNALKDKFGSFTMIFDVCSQLTKKYSRFHPSIKRTGAQLKWGIDNPGDLQNFVKGLNQISTVYVTNSSATKKLSNYYKMVIKLADEIRPAREALRIIVLKID